MKHDLTWFTIFFAPANCRIAVQFIANSQDRLNFHAGIFDGPQQSVDYRILQRDPEHMRSVLKSALGVSREHLLDPLADFITTIQE